MSFSPLFNENKSPHDVDLATFSNYTEIVTEHIQLDWAIDWSKRVIAGAAALTLNAKKDVGEVVLDTAFLEIKKAEVDGVETVSVHTQSRDELGAVS